MAKDVEELKGKMLTMASHVPVLAAVALHTKGPILEFGCGYYSTLLLHEIALINKRQLVTADQDKRWLNQFLYLQNEWHQFEYVENWAKYAKPLKQKWDVVFIDHRPTKRRNVDIRLLKDSVEYMVVHDSNVASYKYEPDFALYKYRYDYTHAEPFTTVLSNKHKLDFLKRVAKE